MYNTCSMLCMRKTLTGLHWWCCNVPFPFKKAHFKLQSTIGMHIYYISSWLTETWWCICVSVYFVNIGSLTGFEAAWGQIEFLSIAPFRTNFTEIWIKIQNFSFQKMHLKMSLANIWPYWPFCSGHNVLNYAWVSYFNWHNWCNSTNDYIPYYRKTSNISRTLVGSKIVDNSDVVGASPVGAAPTTSSFST